MEVTIDSGIDTSTTRVERHEPRKMKMVRPVSTAAITASRITSEMAPDTNTDWSNSILMSTPLGAAPWMIGIAALTLLTTSRVEAEPFL